MAASSLLALIDDIATLLDDVALMSKMAAKKTAGVLGDDLALNAQQVSGVKADRELPVVWAVAKGSLLNKLILVPAALVISAFLPWLIMPLLLIGGLYLCFEGVEKVLHKFLHHDDQQQHQQRLQAMLDEHVDMLALEKNKIRGAIRTDFILSAEIVVISLGAVQHASFITQVGVVSLVALAVTLGVYGIVAAIVKLDDAGLYLQQQTSAWQRQLGAGILWFAPHLMRSLSLIGTIAMFLVGGGILLHALHEWHIHWPEELNHTVLAMLENVPAAGSVLAAIMPTLSSMAWGFVAGLAVLLGVSGVKAALGKH